MEQLFDQADRRLSSGLPLISTIVPGVGLLGALLVPTAHAHAGKTIALALLILPLLFLLSSTSCICLAHAYRKLHLLASSSLHELLVEIGEEPPSFKDTKKEEMIGSLIPDIYKPYLTASILGQWAPFLLSLSGLSQQMNHLTLFLMATACTAITVATYSYYKNKLEKKFFEEAKEPSHTPKPESDAERNRRDKAVVIRQKQDASSAGCQRQQQSVYVNISEVRTTINNCDASRTTHHDPTSPPITDPSASTAAQGSR